jgi:hypothetical protein
MKKALRIIILVMIGIFVIAQFFQPDKNVSPRTEQHILETENVPEHIKTMLTNACLDCHSNQTNYLWYHKISPVSWFINNHIVEGREHLNLSDWGKQDVFDKIGTLEEMVEEVEEGEMPLKEYVWMHPKAKLNEEEIARMKAWSEELSEELIQNSAE